MPHPTVVNSGEGMDTFESEPCWRLYVDMQALA